MRITTAFAYESSVANLQRRQQSLSQSQEQLTSGKRVLRASDDPAAAAAAERALASGARAASQQRAVDASRQAMQLSESALGSAGEMLQQARELVMSAGNGSYGDSDRATIADALRGLRKDLLAVANSSDGAGRYLFGGQGADQPPLLDAPGGVRYVGTAGEQQAAAGDGARLSVDGRAAWLQAPDSTNPGATTSIFDTLDRSIAELLAPGRSGAQVAQTVLDALRGIDDGASNLSAWRARGGESLNRLDRLADRLSQTELDAERDKSDATDLDMVRALSEFQAKKTGYDAALQTYSLVQRMTLFDYIR